jgi:hypothetical protein
MSTTNFSNDPGTASSGPGSRPSDGTDESSGVKGQAQQAAGTASQEGQRVAGVAKDEVKNVAGEAQNQLRGLLDQATTQVDEQSKQQKGRLAETVRTFGDDLHKMTDSEESDGVAAQLVQQVADQARGLASHLEDREPSELLDDVRRFARRRPGAFLLGALAAGVVVGRVARGAKAAQDTPSTGAARPSGSAGTPSPSPAVLTEDPLLTSRGDNGDLPTDLGAKGVEMSEAGISSSRGPA